MRFPLFIYVIKYVLPLLRSICIPGLNVLCFMFLQPVWKFYRFLFLREREGPMLAEHRHMEKEVRIYRANRQPDVYSTYGESGMSPTVSVQLFVLP